MLKNEWVVDSNCTLHMVKDASLLSSLDTAVKKKIYVVGDFSLDIVGHGDIPCRRGHIADVYHVPSLSVLSVYQLAQTSKIVYFLSDQFLVKDLNNDRLITTKGFLHAKDKLYKFHNLSRPFHDPTSLIAQIDERSRVWHEQLKHLNL